MITTTYEWRGQQRVFRVTIVLSLAVHAVLLLFGFWAFGITAKLFPEVHPKPDKYKEEIITISSAPRIAKKNVPVPPSQPVPAPRPPAPQSLPQVAEVPRPLARPKVEPPLPSRELHELAKQAPKAPANPLHTVRRPKITDEPSAPPRTPPPQTPPPEKRVALAENAPRSSPQKASKPAQLSEAQLAQINRDLSHTIAQARSANDPLRVPNQVPGATKRYRISMEGALGDLHHGEGYYYPIRGWKAGGYDYYYVSYEFTYPDGTFETGGVPWPIRFPAAQDPFTHPEIGGLHNTPLPLPPPGYVPPANLGKALRTYFPGVTFAGDASSPAP
jgi:outer membrane biosynthesis protein TonB